MTLTKCDKCELKLSVQKFTYPVEVDGETLTANLCDTHASDEGFCPACGYFVLGSDDDRTLDFHGICAQCLEELKYELGEYDTDGDYDYEGPY